MVKTIQQSKRERIAYWYIKLLKAIKDNVRGDIDYYRLQLAKEGETVGLEEL